MKKILAICMVLGLVIGLTGCQSGTQDLDEQMSAVENDELEEPEESVVDEEKTVEELMSISIGDQVEVNTEYGDFLLTVNAVRKCDWIERIGRDATENVAVLVECDVENISFEDPYEDNFRLHSYLGVTDDEGYVVNKLSFSYNDGQYSMLVEVPRGSKGHIVVPYNCSVNVQNLTININGQYVLETNVEDEVDSQPETTETAEDKADSQSETTETVEKSSTDEYGLGQLVGYDSLVSLPDGSPVTIQGVAHELMDGIYVMEITTGDPGHLSIDTTEYKVIYVLDPILEQSYDKKYISVSGHTDLSSSIPEVIAEIIEDRSEDYINAGGTLE